MIRNPSTPNEVFTTYVNLNQYKTLPEIETKPVRILEPILLCGPSGSGKSTLLKRLMNEFKDYFGFSISRMF